MSVGATLCSQSLIMSPTLSAHRPLTSIFFGGGTPSLMAPRTAEAFIEQGGRALRRRLPTSRSRSKPTRRRPSASALVDFKSAGVNRLSLGVQALDDAALRFLGREHSAKEALAAVDHAARLFSRFSFDLIYARPDQTLDAWSAELKQAPWPCGRPSQRLSAHHRTGHALLQPCISEVS